MTLPPKQARDAVSALAAELADLTYQGRQLPPGHATALATTALRHLGRAETADAAAQLAELHEECDKVGVPHTASGLLRHHIASREFEAQTWRLTHDNVAGQRDALAEAVRRALALHQRRGSVCADDGQAWPCSTVSALHGDAGECACGHGVALHQANELSPVRVCAVCRCRLEPEAATGD